MPRLIYAVWCDLDRSVEEEWERWMRSTHIPQVLKAGGFVGAKVFAVKEDDTRKWVTMYEATDHAALQAYFEGPARRLREDYQKHFGDRTRLTRMVLEEKYSV